MTAYERLRREPEAPDPAREVVGLGSYPLPQLPVGGTDVLPPAGTRTARDDDAGDGAAATGREVTRA